MSVSEGRWSCPKCNGTWVRSKYQDRGQWDTYRASLQTAHGNCKRTVIR